MSESPLNERACGILLHPTSLPGPYGIGDLGPEAHRFVDFLADSGQRWWQMLPITPPGGGNSPYDSPSTFAASPLLVSLEHLQRDGLL
ncbi:MAG TPA: 4-alpha-glucanotransferase, partial [Polyangiaceae bacterium]|nr:4-alpha-glucanotransferase [Polyangiaceae bacterium]